MAFVKGKSGNPMGRPKHVLPDSRSLAEIAREHTAAAVAALVRVMDDPNSPQSATVAASATLLDRGWGRPSQQLTVSGDPENPLQHRVDVSHLTDAELRVLSGIKLEGPANA